MINDGGYKQKLCILQEYCDKGDLGAYIELQRQQGMTCVREQRVKKFIIEILLALDYIHDRKIVHRDVKPSNIFLKGKNFDIKIGDFGVTNSIFNFICCRSQAK